MSRTLTGITPSGRLHLGNLVGAIRPIAAAQRASAPDDTVAFVSDLHALTLEHDPELLRSRTREFVMILLAAGVDPGSCLLMVQSHVPEHTELHYLLECVAGYGEAHRMIQFKQKSEGRENVRLSLLTYPILMAADILLYGTTEVPVGEDQRQHVELARDLAERFNARYGPVFVVPKAVNPPVAARLRDLSEPARKMSKSPRLSTGPSGTGALRLLAPPDELRRVVRRAVTDDLARVAYEPQEQPGVANLLDVLAACTGGEPQELAGRYTRYGDLKNAVADAVIATLEPLQRRYAELAADPEHVDAMLREGAERARAIAAPTVRAAKEALGLLRA